MPDFTGKIRYRKSWTGRLIVELEYRYLYSESMFNENDAESRTAWLEAKAEYLAQVDPSAVIV